jgi:hypothetical protein
MLRISGRSDHPFRWKATTYFGAKRPGVSGQSGPLFEPFVKRVVGMAKEVVFFVKSTTSQ